MNAPILKLLWTFGDILRKVLKATSILSQFPSSFPIFLAHYCRFLGGRFDLDHFKRSSSEDIAGKQLRVAVVESRCWVWRRMGNHVVCRTRRIGGWMD